MATGSTSGFPQAQRARGTPKVSTRTAVPACRTDWRAVAAPGAETVIGDPGVSGQDDRRQPRDESGDRIHRNALDSRPGSRLVGVLLEELNHLVGVALR